MAAGVGPPQTPSSSSNMQPRIPSTELFSIVSELLGPEGISRSKFEALFLLCDGCDRVMPRLGQAEHECAMESFSSDSQLEDDIASVLAK